MHSAARIAHNHRTDSTTMLDTFKITEKKCSPLRAYTRWDIITGPPSFKRHNIASTRFIYMKISGIIAEEMPSLQIWK